MKTTHQKKRVVKKSAPSKKIARPRKVVEQSADTTPSFEEGEAMTLTVSQIDFSPLNHRKYYSQEALQDFAGELAIHGVISPVTVRPGKDGRYELIVGERRLRASQIAKLQTIPGMVRNMTDEQVIEYQLAENIQRENPHPMHEAQAIGQLQAMGKTVDDIALRLGKSKAYVYGRFKLLSLTPDLQELFVADKTNLQTAFEIARLSAESQQEFFAQHCSNWKTKKDFLLRDISYYLRQYHCDMKRAPFDPKSKTLVPEAGACTGCPFNSAVLKSLFPDLAKESICSNRECYRNKCNTHYLHQLGGAFQEHQPAAILYNGQPSPLLVEALEAIPEASGLPAYSHYNVFTLSAPTLPDEEDYHTTEDDDGNSILDETEYEAALQEYKAGLEEYEQIIADGKAIKGLYVSDSGVEVVYFTKERAGGGKEPVTAKQVQEALKNGTATPELLNKEIERMETRETRAKQLDRDKVQITIHKIFTERLKETTECGTPTPEDMAGVRLLIYKGLDWHAKQTVDQVLFPEEKEEDDLIEQLAALTEQQYAYLIRMAMLAKSESKYPGNDFGVGLYLVATGAGIDVPGIEAAQQEKADQRQTKLEIRKKEYEKKIERLQLLPQ